jgi:hypothetical protein
VATLISGQTHRGLAVYWKQTPDRNALDEDLSTTTVRQAIFKNKDGRRYVATGTTNLNGSGAVAPQFTYLPSTADFTALGVGEWFVTFKATFADTTVDYTKPAVVTVEAAP